MPKFTTSPKFKGELKEQLKEAIDATKNVAKQTAVVQAPENETENAQEEAEDENDEDVDYAWTAWAEKEPILDSLAGSDGTFSGTHGAEDRVAVYGGNPAKRRELLEKRLRPYSSLQQFGTPKDVGFGDTNKLLKKISNGAFEVVYSWIRFGSHTQRHVIKSACANTVPPTRFVEVGSLAEIRPEARQA